MMGTVRKNHPICTGCGKETARGASINGKSTYFCKTSGCPQQFKKTYTDADL